MSIRGSIKRVVKRLLGVSGGAAARRPAVQVFSIGIYEGESPTDLSPIDSDINPVLSREDLSDVRGAFIADPFLIRAGDSWNMFFEVYNNDSKRGEIGLAKSMDGRHWAYDRMVLAEPFHLSYPHVFEWEGEYYMMPETFETDSVRLYKADVFPEKWAFHKTLLEGRDYVDPSVFFFGDRWWMLVGHGRPDFRADTLRLFMADSPLGPWSEHPQSPVVADDNSLARPAGRVVVAEGRPIRFSQDCREVYGASVSAFEITRLTPDSYLERPIGDGPILGGTGEGWNATGMHHIDAHRLDDGQWFACVDGWWWGHTA